MSQEAPTQENDFTYTQNLRKRLVTELTAEALPSDPKDREFLRKVLADIDNQQFNHKKLDIDESNANNTKKVADAMLELAKRQGSKNVFERPIEGDAEAVELPALEVERLGKFDYVEGEEHIGVTNETYEEFAKRMGLDDAPSSDNDTPQD